MRWPWTTDRKIIRRNALRVLLYKSFGFYTYDPLDTEYKVFSSREDFFRVCPRPKKYRKTLYDCNRQVMEVMGKLQGYAVGGVTLQWDGDVNHSMLLVVYGDNKAAMFDVNSRKFYDVPGHNPVLLWI